MVATFVRFLAVSGLAAVIASCGHDNGPGGYPGYYEGPCATDYDCVAGTYCVDVAGGTCLAACRSSVDCGPGYTCKNQSRRGAGGKLAVCVAA